jgi:hypothetical protein
MAQGVMAQRPDPVQARIAPYTGQTSLFLFGAVLLIVANFALSAQGSQLLAAILPGWRANPNARNQTSLLDLVGQVIILGALLLIGSVSEEAGTFALVFLAALWLGFLYSNRAMFSGLLSQATPPASSGGGSQSNSNTNAWGQH